ncbi:MAG TPA: hypothetical protein VFY40_01610 [Blastocatellia bacterium]|nr:hypothetical protein [Blastocatellia bacterium]
MSEETNAYFRRRDVKLRLWAGIFAGPAAVALNQQIAYLLVTLNCSYGWSAPVTPAMLIGAALAVGGVFISWGSWRRIGGEGEKGGGDATSRSRFMAVFGLLFSGFSALVIVAMWLPVIFYRQCQR